MNYEIGQYYPTEQCFSKWGTWLPKEEFIIWREENLLKEESGRNLNKSFKIIKDQAGPDLPLGLVGWSLGPRRTEGPQKSKTENVMIFFF